MKDGEIKLLIEKRSETTLFKIIWAHVKKKKKYIIKSIIMTHVTHTRGERYERVPYYKF